MSDQPTHPPFEPTEDAAEPQADASVSEEASTLRTDDGVRRDTLGRRINSNSMKGLAAAHRAKDNQHIRDLATCKKYCEEYKDARNSTSMVAKKMGVSIETVRGWRRELGIALAPGRPNTLRPPEEQQVPQEDKPLFTRGKSILWLFDLLMSNFDKTPDHDWDEDEDGNVDEGDKRRTWVAWRVFLAAAFGVPQSELEFDHSKPDDAPDRRMPDYPGIVAEITRGAAAVAPGASAQEIFERCTGRSLWPTVQAKIVSLIVGRRGGKSYITAIIGIFLACCRYYRLNLGTKGMVMILARDREQASVIRSYILAFLQNVEELRPLLADDPTQKLIELRNGITIEVRAVGDAGTRGYTVVAALTDEIAFWPTDEESVKQDKKVLRALQPAMLGIKGAMLVMLSSPYARRGELFNVYSKFYGKEQARTLVWNADTLSMRPQDDEDLLSQIRDAYEDDPESAKAEYGGLFRSDLESIYSRMAIESVAVPGRFETPYRPQLRYRAFVDPSGGSSDSYVVAVAHDEWRKDQGGQSYRVPVLDKVSEWKAKFDPSVVSEEAIRVLKAYRISRVTGDAYAGEWPREPLKKKGIRYDLSEKTRSELYLDFLPILNSGRCELLDPEHHRVMVNQFANLERRVGRSGKDSVDHPPGGHDDVANAVAGVMVSVGGSRRIRSTW